MTRLTRLCAAVAAAQLMFVSVNADAQQAAQTTNATSAAQVQPMPAVEKPVTDSATRARTSVPLATTEGVALRMNTNASTEMAPAPQMTRSSAAAMMVVGVAAMVAGAVVGDDAGTVLMLAGAGVGLLGLYNYLR